MDIAEKFEVTWREVAVITYRATFTLDELIEQEDDAVQEEIRRRLADGEPVQTVLSDHHLSKLRESDGSSNEDDFVSDGIVIVKAEAVA